MILDIINFLKSADETMNDVHSASGGGEWVVLESGSWSSSKLSDVVTVHVKGLNITLKIGMIGKQLK